MEKKARNFREYPVWQDSVNFATPFSAEAAPPIPLGGRSGFEKKGLCDQLQRAAVSISSNIAEGSARPTDVDFAHFLDLALGSACEVETQLLIANNIGYLSNDIYNTLKENVMHIECQIGGLIRMLRSPK